MAGINVGTHVRKYNTHFDFLNADFFFFVRMWLFDAPKRVTVQLIYV